MKDLTNTGMDAFVVYADEITTFATLKQLAEEPLVRKIFVLTTGDVTCHLKECEVLNVGGVMSSSAVRRMVEVLTAPYMLLCTKQAPITFGYQALRRMVSVANNTDAALVYPDHYAVKQGEMEKCPTMDFSEGSVRDDFDFGSVVLYDADILRSYVAENPDADYRFSGWYDVHLHALRQKGCGSLFHLREFLYTEEELDLRASGEKQFDYVNPRNREVQQEREVVCTYHLKQTGAFIDPDSICDVAVERDIFSCEASVIIPVRNRVRTIEDAIRSALSQKADFSYNVLVVDNLSTDGTTEVIARLAAEDERVVHIIPQRKDLGIGGCWSLAFNDPRCGRFAVQLDSDDLYSGPDTLTRIVAKFYEERCGMVIGSYRMCNFQLETLPPGLIDHREWTDENGRNNALRINGLGAPRAFFTPLLREIGMPNTSYGEDYAVGLAFSRRYKIGRIYDELYLCRRWEGNSDAALTPEQVNRNNIYKDSIRTMEIRARRQLNTFRQGAVTGDDALSMLEQQLPVWKMARQHYEQLAQVTTKEMESDGCRLMAQFNPARIVSTGAKIDAKTIQRRPCFLCEANRPKEQMSLPMLRKYQLLVNPNPILPKHFTIPVNCHGRQQILGSYEDMMAIAMQLDGMLVFYNGPLCGASAPDHLHFQAGSRGMVPMERDWHALYEPKLVPFDSANASEDGAGLFRVTNYLCAAYAIVAATPNESQALFDQLYQKLPVPEGQYEPMMNILAWSETYADGSKRLISVVIPRAKHRPDRYFAEGESQVLVSPGALDMAGMIITPRAEDFERMTPELARDIICECGVED